MSVKTTLEMASLVAGLILVAMTIRTQFGGGRRASDDEVLNIPIQAPTNYLKDVDVQRKIQTAVALGPYKDYSSWIGADPRFRGGL